MKLNIDSEPKDMGVALNVAFMLINTEPNQELGSAGMLTTEYNGLTFTLTRNEDSYTIEVVGEEVV